MEHRHDTQQREVEAARLELPASRHTASLTPIKITINEEKEMDKQNIKEDAVKH